MTILPLLLSFLLWQTPAYEVAAVKPNKSGSGASQSSYKNQRVTMQNVTMEQIVMYAYSIKDYQLQAPAWFKTERYDVNAKAADGTPDSALLAMLQPLLKERFKMVVRNETRDLPVFHLVVDKDGPKPGLHPTDDAATGSSGRGGGPPTPPTAGAGGVGGGGGDGNPSGLASMSSTGNMTAFATFLSRLVERPVIDKTGLTGRYSVALKYVRPAAVDSGAVGPSIFKAIQEELGLRLEPARAPLEIIVIESAERVPVEGLAFAAKGVTPIRLKPSND